MIQRSTPHMFGAGAVQRLAEEMTEALQAARDEAVRQACAGGQPVRRPLTAKGVGFGMISVFRTSVRPCTTRVDTSALLGVDKDLVVRPFQWKGSVAFLRDFNRDASHNELGMQPAELVGDGVDADFDGVADEMSIGDQTSLAVYLAAQPRPTTKQELASLGLIAPLSAAEDAAIQRGRDVFRQAQCATCHVPRLLLNDPLFSEPSQNPNYRDARFPGGQDPLARGVSPLLPITFDLTQDQPDNVLTDGAGQVTFRLGSLRKDPSGRGVVELFGDLKRHDMGPGLAESIDETGCGASTFLTENLWGVGTTAPYLHDGRATTITEAILAHGGEAGPSQAAFTTLPLGAQRDLVAFLESLVLFKK